MAILTTLTDAILNAAYPQACHSCGKKVQQSIYGVACSECWSATEIFGQARINCLKCGAGSLAVDRPASDCPTCRHHEYDLARSIGAYEKAMSASILHLKKVPVIPGLLLDSFPTVLSAFGPENIDLVVPVPLSKKRQFERGFNQANTIGTAVARILDVPVDSASLIRKKHTPMHRAAMDKKAREMTVMNAFEVVRPKLIAGKSVLLVDDIFTSGATVSYCAKALKKKGAAKVKVFTLARAVS